MSKLTPTYRQNKSVRKKNKGKPNIKEIWFCQIKQKANDKKKANLMKLILYTNR